MKLNYKRTFFIGLAFMSISAFWQMYDNLVPLMLQNSFHLKETAVGTIMAMDNVLAVFLLPFFGALSDKVSTPLGKRTPFILAGTALAVISMLFLPAAAGRGSLPMFAAALGVTLLAMGFYRSPSVALMPDLTPKPLRSKANAVINLMGAVGGVYALILIRFLVKKEEIPDYMPVFIGTAILMAAAVLVLIVTVKENALTGKIEQESSEEEKIESGGKLLPEVKKSLIFILLSIFLWYTAYNAVTTAFSRYAQNVWKLEGGGFANCLMVATVAAIISYIPIGAISSKIGRKKTICIGVVMMSACYLCAFFFTSYHFAINAGFALIGIGWAAINVNSFPMVVEMSRGSDIGKYTGLYYTFSMCAQIITPVLSGFFLEKVSYRTLFPYAFVFSTLALFTMLLVKHGDSRPEMKKSVLENFDIDD